jgi:hypothetical protein
MKKILAIILILFLVFNFFVVAVSSNNILKRNPQKYSKSETLIISELFPNPEEYQIKFFNNGQKISVDNFGYIMEPGMPLLPCKNIYVALPPGAKIKSVDIERIKEEELPGSYSIIPASYSIPLHGFNKNSDLNYKYEWLNNFNSVYLSDEPYPKIPGKIVDSGNFGQFNYVLVSIYPFKYYPISGRLFFYESAVITINYDCLSQNNIKWNHNAEKLAKNLFTNYEEIKGTYEPVNIFPSSKDETYNYVIITSSNLYDTIMSTSFISWKNLIGYNIKIVNVTDSEITSQSGIDLVEKIRNFLREYYYDWNIEYVLIIGNSATVPMRYCYPDPFNHMNTAGTPGGNGGEIPTDYYYADLSNSDSNSWDSDGDGFHGEYGHDTPDFLPEVYVGRIPIDNPSRIVYTLEKTVSFEQDIGNWKQNALHPAAFFYFTDELGIGEPAMDGATCCAYIESDFMDGWNVSCYSEQEGLEKSVYPWKPLSEYAFATDWRTGKYSIVNWGAHGWTDLIARKVWNWDDGDNIPEANEMWWPNMLSTSSYLDDDYPSIVTCISCYVGYPEPNNYGNMGIDLLTRPTYGASVGVIASARTPYGTIDWPTTPGASDSIIYEFNRYLINESQKVGEALFNSKHFCNVNYDWYGWVEYNDLYTYNLFGDPSLTLEGIYIGEKPDKPSTPKGPDSGSVGVQYTYSTSTSDPDNDNIYYKFDWGDGSDSGWLGPYESGEICEAKHIWTKKASYEIKSRAKDTHELISEWSETFKVNIPRYKAKNSNILMSLFERLTKLFVNLGFILQ